MTDILPSLSRDQRDLVERPIADGARFLEGPAGTGKTTVAVARLRHILMQGVSATDILVLAPQRTLLRPYQRVLRSADLPPGATVATVTIGGLARRMVDRFWPLVAERAGFAHPDRPPVFLTLETAKYYMARIAAPLRPYAPPRIGECCSAGDWVERSEPAGSRRSTLPTDSIGVAYQYLDAL